MSETNPTPAVNASNDSSSKTLGIVSLISGILPFSLVAIVTGHISLSKFKKQENKDGRGFALAGTILGWLQLAFTALLLPLVLIPTFTGMVESANQETMSSYEEIGQDSVDAIDEAIDELAENGN